MKETIKMNRFSLACIPLFLLMLSSCLSANDTLSLSTGTLIKYSIYEGYPINYAQSIMEDSKGNIWIATVDGVFKYSSGSIIHYTLEEGLGGLDCTSVFEDGEGTIWVGHHNFDGMSCYKDGAWLNIVSGDETPRIVYAFNEGIDGNLYISGRDKDFNPHIFIYDGISFEKLWLPWEGYDEITLGQDGKLYVSSYSNLLVYDYDSWESYYSSFHSLYNKIQDASGFFWITSAGAGLKKFKDGVFEATFTYLNTQGGLLSDECFDVELQSSDSKRKVDELWVVTRSGVCTYDGQSWDKQSELNDAFVELSDLDWISAKWVYDIMFDSRGNMWFATRDGFYEYKPTFTVSSEDLEAEHSIEIYPNPVNDILNIEMDGVPQAKALIVNVQGETVYSNMSLYEGSQQFDLGALTSGMYILLIEIADKTYSYILNKL